MRYSPLFANLLIMIENGSTLKVGARYMTGFRGILKVWSSQYAWRKISNGIKVMSRFISQSLN